MTDMPDEAASFGPAPYPINSSRLRAPSRLRVRWPALRPAPLGSLCPAAKEKGSEVLGGTSDPCPFELRSRYRRSPPRPLGFVVAVPSAASIASSPVEPGGIVGPIGSGRTVIVFEYDLPLAVIVTL